MALIADARGAGTACLLATHDEIAFDVADRVLELHDGRLHPLAMTSAAGPGPRRRSVAGGDGARRNRPSVG